MHVFGRIRQRIEGARNSNTKGTVVVGCPNKNSILLAYKYKRSTTSHDATLTLLKEKEGSGSEVPLSVGTSTGVV